MDVPVGPAGASGPAGTAEVARGTGLRTRALVLASLVGLTTAVSLVDPEGGGYYPPCPSRALYGLDCPGCGGLRGVNALAHGRIGEALDHNLLLPAVLAVAGVALGLWLLPLVGRPARVLHPPRWAVVAACLVVATFTLLRNLPLPGLELLASDA